MKKYIKSFVDPIVVLLKLTCFLLAGYMIYLQFSAFVTNDDSTALSYEVFQDDTNQFYPTFSLCLFGNEEHLFTGSASVCPPCVNETDKKEECTTNHCQAREYFQILTGKQNDSFNFLSVPFSKKVFNLLGDIQYFHVTTESGKKIVKTNNLNAAFLPNWKLKKYGPALKISYQDPSNICYTKNDSDVTGQRLAHEFIKMNVKKFVTGHTVGLIKPDIKIFIHQKHQLIRKLRTPTVWIRMFDLKDAAGNFKDGFTQKIDLRIDSIEVLKKRKNSVKPCNDTLSNEDKTWIETTINTMGCVPPFFKRFVSNVTRISNELTQKSCKKEQLAAFRKAYSPNRHFETIENEYLQPCGQMIASVASTEALIPKVARSDLVDPWVTKNRIKTYDVNIGIRYGLATYKVATNNQAFTLLSLWSQIGGFVGIFLGFSLLQVADLLKKLAAMTKLLN